METDNVEDTALYDNVMLKMDFNTSTPSSSAAGLSARSATFYSMGFEEFHCIERNSQWFTYIKIITPSSNIWTTMSSNVVLIEKHYV